MLNAHYAECRPLPAINETFPQFSHHRPSISLLSPLDLSLRAANLIPITPPSTPSPPRKRQRLMSEENYLWRPHAMSTTPPPPPTSHAAVISAQATASLTAIQQPGGHHQPTSTITSAAAGSAATSATSSSSYFHNELDYGLRFHAGSQATATKNNFEQIPLSQSSVANSQFERGSAYPAAIYVDDETIVLTEDEDETLVSSHDYNDEDSESEDVVIGIDVDDGDVDEDVASTGTETRQINNLNQSDVGELEDDDVYVDILSNDDDDDNNLLESAANGKVLTRHQLIYDDVELHNQAVDGLEKLFDRDFQMPTESSTTMTTTEKTYTDLTYCKPASGTETNSLPMTSNKEPVPYRTNVTRTHKADRKRSKLRKHTAIDEETISPVSGTIIRKLRDDEELVVRKGDIDPAFNVVEITEEAKAILASIDNKIGAYLCQLCRTVYDDAFMLAQHRCPRIVHIEYKCSECDKVFNCPANLASHRRWHKPKSEIPSSKQTKSRSSNASEQSTAEPTSSQQKQNQDDSGEGIFPCPQCGKTFRRHAYLKKHQSSHQILENLKNFDFFKTSHPPTHSFPTPQYPIFSSNNINSSSSNSGGSNVPPTTTAHMLRAPTHQPTARYPAATKPYAPRFSGFTFQPFDQRRFYSLGEFYLSQHLERSSAFQYVQANHLRQLSNAANNLLPRPLAMPLATSTMPVK